MNEIEEREYRQQADWVIFGIDPKEPMMDNLIKKLRFFEKQFANQNMPKIEYFQRQIKHLEQNGYEESTCNNSTIRWSVTNSDLDSLDIINKNNEAISQAIGSEHDFMSESPNSKFRASFVSKMTQLQFDKLKKAVEQDWFIVFNQLLKRLVINPKSRVYIFWSILGMVFALIEAVLYPFCMAQGFPTEVQHPINLLLISSMVYFAFDIPVNFILGIEKEGEKDEFVNDPTHIRKLYMSGSFMEDIFLTMPLGFIGGFLISQLEILHIIKVLRLKNISDVLSPPFYMPHIRNFYRKRLQEVLQDPKKANNICQSNN